MENIDPQATAASSISSLFYSLLQLDMNNRNVSFALADDTVRNIIRDELLLDAVIWLLGYDASMPVWLDATAMNLPIRPQRENSHWATAWCIVLFLQAHTFLASRHSDVVREIDRRLTSNDANLNPLLWLLHEAMDATNGRMLWYGKEYDNAVAALALLEVKRAAQAQSYTFQISSTTLAEVDRVLACSLRWLWDRVHRSVESGTTDDEAIAVLEPLLVATSEFGAFLEQHVWRGEYAARHADLLQAFQSWITVLEARRSTESGPTTRLVDGRVHHQTDDLELTSDEAYALCQFVLMSRELKTDESNIESDTLVDLAQRAQAILVDYIAFLELGVQRDLWGGNISRIQRLGTYIQAWGAATLRFDPIVPKYVPDAHCMAIVLKVLSMIKQDQFSNGSIFHSSLPTVHLARSLIFLWHWPSADKPLLVLFSRVLDDFAVRSSHERLENLELHKEIINLERSIVANKREKEQLTRRIEEQSRAHKRVISRERRRRYLVMVWFWVLLSAASVPIIDVIFDLSRSDLLTFAGVIAASLAIVLVVIETVFVRRESGGAGGTEP